MARIVRVDRMVVPALVRLGPDAESEPVRPVGAIRLLDTNQPSVVMNVESQSVRELLSSHASVRVDVHFPIDVPRPDPKALLRSVTRLPQLGGTLIHRSIPSRVIQRSAAVRPRPHAEQTPPLHDPVVTVVPIAP
jgi:hypothetical protein